MLKLQILRGSFLGGKNIVCRKLPGSWHVVFDLLWGSSLVADQRCAVMGWEMCAYPVASPLARAAEPTPDGNPKRERSDTEVDEWVCDRL